MTNGKKSSERKACYDAAGLGFLVALVGIYSQIDTTGLAAVIVAVNTPLMWYAGARSYVKGKHGEKDNV